MIQNIFRLKFVLLLVFNSFAGALIYAADGDLDSTFNGSGFVITDNNSTSDYFSTLAVQPDGKVVIAGTSEGRGIVIRYNLDGSLDGSFGTGGKAVIPNPVGGSTQTAMNSLAIAPDGKIVFAGTRTIFQFDRQTIDIFVGILNSNGTPDTNFNGTGTALFDLQAQGDDRGYSVLVQPDGKILVSGTSSASFSPSKYDFVLLRLNPNGTYDQTFNGGLAITQITPVRDAVNPNDIALQPDGKIVAVGRTGVVVSLDPVQIVQFVFAARYNSNGTLDQTFDGDGIALTRQSAYEAYGNTVSVTPDGKILAAGRARTTSTLTGYFVKFNADGSLDSTFGTGGAFLSEFAPISDTEVQADGKILATAGTGVLRLYPNGAIDNTFGGGDGYAAIPVPSGLNYYVGDLGLDAARRKVYVGGFTVVNSTYDFLTARFISDLCATNCNAPRNKVSDFDGDGKSDQAVFRPNGGVWHLLRSASGYTAAQFGSSSDKIAPADFDNDGKTDIAVFRDGSWYWLESSTGAFRGAQFGQTGDIPVPADYTGDGRADLAVYRGGSWHIFNLADNRYQVVQFGLSTDKTVPADYDGDGKTDIAVFRNGEWYIQRSTAGFLGVQFGQTGDVPAVGDYDGDSKADLAVHRGGDWYILGSARGFYGVRFGLSTDVPTPADYDGDGKTDVAVFRNGEWYMLRSQQGFGTIVFGQTGDKPIASAFSQ